VKIKPIDLQERKHFCNEETMIIDFSSDYFSAVDPFLFMEVTKVSISINDRHIQLKQNENRRSLK